MSLHLDWNESFTVGIPSLDAQHRVLFDIANSIPERADEQLAGTCILRLFKYTREHFQAEESEMRKMGYPKLSQHVEIHNQLIDRLSKISAKPPDTDASNIEFKRFVLHWIVDHIMICDKGYHRHALEHPIL
jgi:hemerythrin-like metal-binding protein